MSVSVRDPLPRTLASVQQPDSSAAKDDGLHGGPGADRVPLQAEGGESRAISWTERGEGS